MSSRLFDEDEDDGLSDEGLDVFAGFIVRPPRAKYTINDLGPTHDTIKNVRVTRQDFEVMNSRKLRLSCSIWEPQTEKQPGDPCVIYLHGNASCRSEALAIAPAVLPYGIKLVGFDFSGSGQSEGQYVSLGVFEKEDVGFVVNYVRQNNLAQDIALWGHSMGAATALMFIGSIPNPPVSCAIYDSAYASFEKLAEGFVDQLQLPSGLPKKLVLSIGVRRVRKVVKAKADFDINDVNPLKHAKSIKQTPCKFIHGTKDDVVEYVNAEALFKAYGCPDKELVKVVNGEHTPMRPRSVEDRALSLVLRTLLPVVAYLTTLKARANHHLVEGDVENSTTLFTFIIGDAERLLNQPDEEDEENQEDEEEQPSLAAATLGPSDDETVKPSASKRFFSRRFQKKEEQPTLRQVSAESKRKLFSFRGKDTLKFQSKRLGAMKLSEVKADVDKPIITPLSEDQKRDLKALLIAVYGNRSLAHLLIERGEEALADANKALNLNEKWIRGYHRKASALKLMGRLDEARAAIEKGLDIDPNNQALIDLLKALRENQS